MALPPGTCPSGYSYYNCASPPFTGCCSVDPCGAGCPPGKEYSLGSTASGSAPPITPPSFTPETAQSSSSRSITSLTSKSTRTVTGAPDGTVSTTPVTSLTSGVTGTVKGPDGAISTTQIPTFSTAQSDARTSSTQKSPTASSAQIGGKSPGHSSSPLLSIIAISIGGALGILIIVLIIFLYRRRRRRRKSENSGGGLPTHSGVPEPTLDEGPVTDERGGFLDRFKRPRPTSIAKTTIELTSSPSTTHPEELPSPSFPSEHNSVIPGFAELPISSVSELSSADRGVYSSTNVSTASTGAVVSPVPHDSLRGGGRPAMMPNMVPAGREQRRKHALSWQSFEPGDGQ